MKLATVLASAALLIAFNSVAAEPATAPTLDTKVSQKKFEVHVPSQKMAVQKKPKKVNKPNNTFIKKADPFPICIPTRTHTCPP